MTTPLDDNHPIQRTVNVTLHRMVDQAIKLSVFPCVNIGDVIIIEIEDANGKSVTDYKIKVE